MPEIETPTPYDEEYQLLQDSDGDIERIGELRARIVSWLARDTLAREQPAQLGEALQAMKATTGFLKFVLIHAAASSSALPPISPIMMTPSVSGSSANNFRASIWVVPISGSPPIPMHVV